MKCKVTIQILEHGGYVDVPEHFNGFSSIKDGMLYLIEYPTRVYANIAIETSEPKEDKIKKWWEFWR